MSASQAQFKRIDHGNLETRGDELPGVLKILAHDLSAPVRHIRFFHGRLYQSLGDHPDEVQREASEYIENGLSKLDQMLDAVGHYARLISGYKPADGVHCGEIFTLLERRVAATLAQAEASLEIPKCDETLSCDVQQLVELFVHLIDNAVKFYSGEGSLLLSLSVDICDNFLVFDFSDNGPGLEEGNYDYLIQFLRRGSTEQSGIGSGLAFADRIVANHAGNLGFAPINPHGLKVTITLPR